MTMKQALNDLSERQVAFICKECGLSEKELFSMSEDDLYNRVYDPMCDIEIAEIPTDDTAESEHCAAASEIVTILGNAMAKANGLFYECDRTE